MKDKDTQQWEQYREDLKYMLHQQFLDDILKSKNIELSN